MAAVRPECFTEHVQKMKQAAEFQPGTLVLVARILGIIGKLNIVSCIYCVVMKIVYNFSCLHQINLHIVTFMKVLMSKGSGLNFSA